MSAKSIRKKILFIIGGIFIFNPTFSSDNRFEKSSSNFLIVLEPPVLNQVIPATAAEGDTVILRGRYFAGATGVRFGGNTPATSFQVLSDTVIQAVVPQQGNGSVEVMTPSGTASLYTFTHKGPGVVFISPIFAGTGSVLTVNGSQLSQVTEIKISDVPVASFTILSDQQIRVIKATAPSGPMSVKNAFGTTVTGYINDSDPQIDSIKPLEGTLGDTVTLYGRIQYNPATVTVGGINVTSFWTPGPPPPPPATKLFFKLGAGTTGTVTLSGPSGTRSFGNFIYYKRVLLCAGGSTSLPAGKTGSVYQWLVNKGSGFEAIGDTGIYSGTSTATLNLTNVPSNQYGWKYRCTVDGQNTDEQRLQFRNNWVGGSSGNWESPTNWSCSSAPESNTDVVITSGNIVISSNVQCRSLILGAGASMTVTPGFALVITH